MKTTTRRATSLSAAVTLLASLAMPAMALEAEIAPPLECSPAIVDGALVLCDDAPVEEPVAEETVAEEPAVEETVADEPVVDEAPAAPACVVHVGQLYCSPAGTDPLVHFGLVPAPEVEVPEAEVPEVVVVEVPEVVAPAPAPAPVVELPLSLNDDLVTESEAPQVLGISVCPPVTIFVDVADCADNAVFLGNANGDLQLGNLLSRGQAAATIVRLLDLTDLAGLPTGADHFTDDNGTVHETAINRVVDYGILRGTTDGLANAGATVTGAQFASMLHRTLVHTGTFQSHATTHTAAAEDLAAVGIHLADGAVTRGAAADAIQGLLDQLQG